MADIERIIYDIEVGLAGVGGMFTDTGEALRTLEDGVWAEIQEAYEYGVYPTLEAAQEAFVDWRTRWLGETGLRGAGTV